MQRGLRSRYYPARKRAEQSPHDELDVIDPRLPENAKQPHFADTKSEDVSKTNDVIKRDTAVIYTQRSLCLTYPKSVVILSC